MNEDLQQGDVDRYTLSAKGKYSFFDVKESG